MRSVYLGAKEEIIRVEESRGPGEGSGASHFPGFPRGLIRTDDCSLISK